MNMDLESSQWGNVRPRSWSGGFMGASDELAFIHSDRLDTNLETREKMSFSFTATKGSYEQRWIVYALLRDNVQHYFEGGQPSDTFGETHAIAGALGGSKVKLSANRLRNELLRAKADLCSRPIADLAISLRTRSVMSLKWPPPEQRATMLLSETRETVPLLGDLPATLDGVFGHFIEGLLGITEGCGPDDIVEVVDL